MSRSKQKINSEEISPALPRVNNGTLQLYMLYKMAKVLLQPFQKLLKILPQSKVKIDLTVSLWFLKCSNTI